MSAPLKFGIIGAGMLGLTLAYRLRKSGHDVTILDAAPEIGGQTSTWQLGPLTWDRHYHVISQDDSHLLALCAELGLEDKVRWSPTRTGFFARGKLYSLSNIIEFIKFPVISFWDKGRLALTLLRAASLKDLKPYENETSIRWLTRWSGKNTCEKLWSPLLQSKFGAQFSDLSASFIISNIQRMFGARKGRSKQEVFGYVQGGYETILSALQRELTRMGVDIRLSTPAGTVTQEANSVTIALPDDTTLTCDRAIITAAPPLLPDLCPQLSPEEKKRLAEVEYLGIICTSLLLDQPISSYYITNILDRWVPFTGIIEMSALVDKAEFAGHSLVYLPRYVPSGAAELIMAETGHETRTLEVLEKMYPAFSRSHVRSFKVSRVKYIVPVPTAHLQQNPLPVKTSLPGIYTLNTGHITDGVLTVNKVMALAEQHLPEVLAPA